MVNMPDNELLRYLFEVDYNWTILLDQNRAQDGIDLRCFWANMHGLDKERYDKIFGLKPCSVLEMLVAFANRIETDFMDSVECNRVPTWFQQLLYNLGLMECVNTFDQGKVDHILLFFFNHQISLFKVPGMDISHMQLWDQMNAWLNYSRR